MASPLPWPGFSAECRMNHECAPPEEPLNRFLRVAILAGAEAAVCLHVGRGDNLNARDSDGMTPLMLAASRNKAQICVLLLAAGADLTLRDSSGRDALGIAKAMGASDAAAILAPRTSTLVAPGPDESESASASLHSESERVEDAAGPAQISAPEPVPEAGREAAVHANPEREPAPDAGGEVCSDEVLSAQNREGITEASSGWEPEEDSPPPPADATLAAAASAAHAELSTHEPIDTAEDWEDFEGFLPEHAVPLSVAADDEQRERIRRTLLRGLRGGSVPSAEVEALCANHDDERNEEREAQLRIVLGDLGVDVDDGPRTEGDSYDYGDYNLEIETQVSEAMAFLGDLSSRATEPLAIYVKEMMRRRLLTAEEEPALAQEMEQWADCAISELASWPKGVAAVLAAAERVRNGVTNVEDVSTGGMPELLLGEAHEKEIEASPRDKPRAGADSDAEDADEAPRELSGAASRFLEIAEEMRRLSGRAGKGGARQKALRDVLASANLSRPFLLSLRNGGTVEPESAEGRFLAAMARESAARERLAVSNLRLAFSLARRHLGRGLPLEDLVQEANIGLLKAVDRFDWRRGFRFSTYAIWWIRQQITRAVADKGRTIRTPVHFHELMMKTARVADATEKATGHPPSREDLALAMSVSLTKVEAMLARMEEPATLHEPDSDGVFPEDIIADPASPDPSLTIERFQLAAKLRGLLEQVDPKAAGVITIRFGLGTDESRTLEETGEVFRLTRERIRQIEAKTLKKLRHPRRAAVLRSFLGAVRKKRQAHSASAGEEVTALPHTKKPKRAKTKGKKQRDTKKGARGSAVSGQR